MGIDDFGDGKHFKKVCNFDSFVIISVLFPFKHEIQMKN